MFKEVNNFDAIGTSTANGGPVWPWFDSTYINSATIPPYLSLGAKFNLKGKNHDGGGNSFMCVRASEGLTVGQLVSPVVPTVTDIVASTVTNLNTTTQLIVTGMTTTASEVGNFLFIANSADATLGFVIREILEQRKNDGTTPGFTGVNTAFVISNVDWTVASKPKDADALVTAPVNPNPVKLYRPYNVGVNIATTTPCGVALGTVTSGYYTIIQVAGLALISSVGNGTALAAGVLAIGAAAGVAIGSTAGATPYGGGSTMIPLQAYAAAGPALQPFHCNFIGSI